VYIFSNHTVNFRVIFIISHLKVFLFNPYEEVSVNLSFSVCEPLTKNIESAKIKMMNKYRFFKNKTPDTDLQSNDILRKEPPNERSLFLIIGLVLSVTVIEFVLVSLPHVFSESTNFNEQALLGALCFLIGGAIYHTFIYVYDREGAVYPVFIAEILLACLHLFTVSEEKNGLIIPREVLSVSALHILSIVTFLPPLALTVILSVMLLKKRQFDNIAKVYIIMLAIGIIINLALLLPIKPIQELFVPQILPVTLLILSQSMMIESHDEHYLSANKAALKMLSEKRRDMVTTISHETRTPLAVISNYASLIAADLRAKGVNEQQAKDLDHMLRQIQVINKIIQEYAENITEKPAANDESESVSLFDIVRHTTETYNDIPKNAGITVKLQIPKGLPDVRTNPEKLTQVLLNLIKNAATHSGAAEMIISAFPGKSGFVIVSFKDNGQGFPADIQSKIFERGVSSCKNSTCTECEGIGLAICKEIITDAGGKISAFNDGGANIIFTLPIFSEGNPDNESEDTSR
jgi:signal transduction histidine kinase